LTSRRRKRDAESSSDRTHEKPTSKRVAMKTTIERVANTTNMPVGCHGNMEGKEEVATPSMPYEIVEIDKHVASGVQTVMFSEKRSIYLS
jgi:hypothetical protein